MTVIWVNKQKQNVPRFLLKPVEIGAWLSVVFRGWGWTAESLRLQAAPPATSRLLNLEGLLGWTEQGFGTFPHLWESVSWGHVMGTQKRDTNRQIFLDCWVQMPAGTPSTQPCHPAMEQTCKPEAILSIWNRLCRGAGTGSARCRWAWDLGHGSSGVCSPSPHVQLGGFACFCVVRVA